MGGTRGRRRAVVVLGAALAGMALASRPWACALDVNRYAHTSWKVREGFSKGSIYSIAQMPDGYLWLGTEFALLRFDGVKTVPCQPPGDQPLPSSVNTPLLAARDGTLWIATIKGLASWKDGKLTQYPQLAGLVPGPLLEDRDRTDHSGRSRIRKIARCAPVDVFGARTMIKL